MRSKQNYLNHKIFSKLFLAPFSCEYEGKRYRSLDKFTSGANGCAQCICLDGRVDCDESKCQILVDPPETSTVPVIEPRFIPNHQPPSAAPSPPPTTSTTRSTSRAPATRTDTRGSEKGPDLGYYANRLTDVNHNRDKGPTETMPYMPMPEQYQYMQAQASPGLRGPPGTFS